MAPAEYGRRLVPNVIDEIAQRDPQREAFQIPRGSEPQDGWKIVTFHEYANAINRCALNILENCSKPESGEYSTIAYIGPQDARYVVMVIGAVKAGYKALFLSPRNTQEGQINLLSQTECQYVSFPESHRAMVQPWLQHRKMKEVALGSLENLFAAEQVSHVPYDKGFEAAEWEPFCVLHTSGSTGLPRPITVNQGMLSIGDAYHNTPEWQGFTHWIPAWTKVAKRHFIPMPLYHAAALYTFIHMVVYWETPVVLGLSDRPLTPDLVVQCLNNLDVELIALPPSVLEEMSHSEEGVRSLRKLKLVVFGGGNLAREAGDRLVKNGVMLNNTLNSTEFSPYPVYFQPRTELWQWLIINSDSFGCDWRQADDDAYELVIVRKDQHPGMQGFFYTFPELQEFSNRDLYKRHPTLPDHWIYYGRADSVIVFSNGEKLNPVTIEETIQDHPWVSGALVVGSERIQPALLLEPFKTLTSDTEKSNFIEEIWPLVVKANQETVAHGRISRELVTVSSPDKPFTRSGKGTVQRGATTKLFAAEIDLLYENAEQASFPRAFPLDFSSEDTLTETIVKNLDGLMLNQALDVNTNFFAMGMDSLQVINLSRLLRASLKSLDYDAQATQIVPRVIYNHPTASRLALYILSLIRNEGDMNGKVEDQESGEIQAMKTLYVRYTKDFSRGRSNRPDSCHTDQTILLTGSTGTLGSYILDQLIKEPAVRKVICLNRASDGGAKQQAEAVEQRGLKPDYLSKAEFHQFDVSQPDLGVSEPIYTQILAEVDRIIHNAWLVNYNLTTETFAPHLQGVRSIADIAANSQKRASVIFISSIATADKWDTSKGPVKEDRLENWTLPSNGYGRSKMVGSLILNEASKIGEFPAAIIRVGQIAGPEAQKGVWSKQEWLPSIIASSLHLGVLPRQLGVANRVDWMPVERTAKLILDIAFATELSGYFHAVNPYATSWEELVPAIQRFYGDRIERLVGFEDWVEILESSQNRAFDSKVMDSNPGLKLLDSYRGMCGTELSKPVVFDVQRTMGISSTLRNMKGITSEMMEHWCRQWDF